MTARRSSCCLLPFLLAVCVTIQAQTVDFLDHQNISTTNTARFVAAHGRRSVILGYPRQGLEVWAYPLQLLSDFRIGFLDNGASSEADALPLLRRLLYAPDSVTLIYVGPDYVVREKLFVPLDQPAAVVTYQVESEHPLDIVVHFKPSLNLMWPGSIGGQYTQWDPASGSYAIAFSGGSDDSVSAVVGSPETVAHDPTINSTFDTGQHYAFTIRPHPSLDTPGTATARVYIAQRASGESAAATLHKLIGESAGSQVEASAHYARLETEELRLQTPDEQVNSAFAWAEIALDQAWVCNPQLGCGIVAGYGPSRSGRRPQYDWFFGGDGLIATNGLISAANYRRAREELEFIIKYQDATTGMVWHELSQSAGYIDWSKYPYMFVHVDITFDYLKTVARYVAVSGDTNFLREHWPSISNAYRYCLSVIDPKDHFPHIPAGKEGGDEQHRPADDLGLSASWVAAARSYAQLAETAGHAREASEAAHQADLAQVSIGAHYWDAKENFWLDGHSKDGEAIFTRRSGFGEAVDEHIFSASQIDSLLDQISSAKFQSDWGVRGAAPNTSSYNAWSYSTASTTAPQTDYLADTYWQNNRSDVALAMWRTTLPWNWLDSPGHIPELLAGNYYIEQAESVPEQTWSSAGFLDSAVRGLLGIQVFGAENAVHFQPRLPAEWDHVSIDHLKLPHSTIGFNINQGSSEVGLDIRNSGQATAIDFSPRIPLGARLTTATCDGRPVIAGLEKHQQDEYARVKIKAPSGDSHCDIHYSGGVALVFPSPHPLYGDPSTGLKLTSLHLDGRSLLLDLDVNSLGSNHFILRSPWKVSDVEGAHIISSTSQTSEIEVDPSTDARNLYEHIRVVVHFGAAD